MTRITTKNQPARTITVGDRELQDLERLGLVDTYKSGPKAKKATSSSSSGTDDQAKASDDTKEGAQ